VILQLTRQVPQLIKVRSVEPLGGHWIRLSFPDGAVKDIDVSGLLSAGGMFAPIRERREPFEQVRVNPETQTDEWPGEVDLDLMSSTAATSPPPASGSNVGQCAGTSSAAHA
jgi:Protein of unknown function (DUF2442)